MWMIEEKVEESYIDADGFWVFAQRLSEGLWIAVWRRGIAVCCRDGSCRFSRHGRLVGAKEGEQNGISISLGAKPLQESCRR